MSNSWVSESMMHFRDDVRGLVRRASGQEEALHLLVRTAEEDVRDADAAVSSAGAALGGGAADWVHACTARAGRSRDHADATRRACVGAREQHVAARRLLGRLEDERALDREVGYHQPAAAVLIVDDVEDTRELVALVLQNAGFMVRTAVNGVDALIAAHEMHPAVIVMDVAMPVLNGIEATRLIKATEATKDAKVIAHTADPGMPEVRGGRLFVAVVPKPSTPELLLATVQKAAGL